ncbi:FxLYD domain-containing protein [Candidatus Nitrosocosmicus hydrocola]|uniref:FxLYD domain-containing protein n=1 Tax=Candidatus Nitrosocosmicus hydrocola TaxID=1826872 RepID=UPI0011E60548|nr:FxLYD domain-containing protein [Candidatus Nitrosocosmicus hydrocola]
MFLEKSTVVKTFVLCIIFSALLVIMSLKMPPSFSQENENSDIILLNITDINLKNSTTGLTSITGTIQNNSTENVENLQIDVWLLDAYNKVIRDTSRFVSGPFTVYEPNSTETFSFLMSVEEFDNYKATAYAEPVS